MRPLSVVRSLASLLFVAGSLATMPGRAEANIAGTFPQKPTVLGHELAMPAMVSSVGSLQTGHRGALRPEEGPIRWRG